MNILKRFIAVVLAASLATPAYAQISGYSTTAASNTTVGGISIAEGAPPGNMNNMGRAIMADLASYYSAAGQKHSSRVGIGGAHDSAYMLNLVGDGTNTAGTRFLNNGASIAYLAFTGATATDFELFNAANGYLRFATNNAEAARFDSSRNLLIGTTTAGAGVGFSTKVAIDATSSDEGLLVKIDGASGDPLILWNAATAGNNIFASFYTEAAGTSRGTISYNRAGGLVAYNTTSDRRAKDLFGSYVSAGQLIDAVPVHDARMKGATVNRPMFVADELQDGGAGFAVTGERNAVDANGKPLFQQVDAASLVPVLWAEVQSLRARMAALEAR